MPFPLFPLPRSTQVVPLRNAREQLNANIAALEAKLQEAQGKRETLKARAASAKSAKALKEMIGGMGADTSTAFAAFEKMESKVQQMEAEAEVAGQLVSEDGSYACCGRVSRHLDMIACAHGPCCCSCCVSATFCANCQ